MKTLFSTLFIFIVLVSHAQNTQDTLQSLKLQDVVIAASRLKESILTSSAGVQKLTGKSIALSPAPSFFDALEHVQGVQIITPSLGFRVLNARGFANTTNVRFAQLVDGMDIQSPHIGGAIGNSLGPTDLDIENVEILPGTASALYGMNTVNGLANFITKNPFNAPGVAIQQKTAITHLHDDNSKSKAFSETSLSIAHIIASKWAFKINGAFTRGYDWMAMDRTDLNPNANSSTGLSIDDNPAMDPVNDYGNESANRKTIALGGKKYVVSRTGYQEKDVVDYNLQNIKGDAGIYYKMADNVLLIYTYHFAFLDNVYQRSNRFRLQDYLVQQHGLQYQSKSIQAKIYTNSENTGKSYNLRSMAENIDKSFKADNVWFADYTIGYNQAISGGATIADALKQARTFADADRYLPGNAAFQEQLEKLQDINNWDIGAALRVQASFVHAEAQLNVTEQYWTSLKDKYDIDLLVGIDHRTYIIVPDGNYFVNPESNRANDNIFFRKTGGFVSISKSIFNNKLKTGLVLRGDKCDYFAFKLNTRLTAVYSLNSKNHFRLAYQSGNRFPSIFEAYSNVNSGGVKRVGGLPVMSNGIFEHAWLQSSITTFQRAVLADINQGGLTQNVAIEKNKNILKKNTYTYLQPEFIRTIEAGYKGLFFNRKMYFNTDLYFSRYNNFIAQTNMNVPKSQDPAAIPYDLYDKAQQSPYRMWTNSQSIIYNYGFSAGTNYELSNGFSIATNATFSKLKNTENGDGLEDGFNTPEWMLNASLVKRNIFRNTDASVVYKWRSSYYWVSFLVNGDVPAYSNLDAQATYHLRQLKTTVKLGASNLFNHYYRSFLAAPAVGGMYYATITYGLH